MGSMKTLLQMLPAFLPLEHVCEDEQFINDIFQISQQHGVISEKLIFPYLRGTNFIPMTETKPL